MKKLKTILVSIFALCVAAPLAARAAERFQQQLAKEIGEDVVKSLGNPESLKRAIDDLSKKYPDYRNDGKRVP